MIPHAGDELTEVIVQQYLVDFKTAETMKRQSTEMNEITYEDIMGMEQTITAEEVVAICQAEMERMAKLTAAIKR